MPNGCRQVNPRSLSSEISDRAIWTSFLPFRIEKLSFNLATLGKKHSDAKLSVHSHITGFYPTTRKSRAEISADILVYNGSGATEVQVEGLWVQSLNLASKEKALLKPHELCIHTSFFVDPEDEIIHPAPASMMEEVPDSLIECGVRVARFYLGSSGHFISIDAVRRALEPSLVPCLSPARVVTASSHLWPGDTEASIDEVIVTSPHFAALDFIRDLGQNLPDLLPGVLPTILTEEAQFGRLREHVKLTLRQISHRYPRMSVLSMTESDYGLTQSILTGLGDSFLSMTIGTEPEQNLRNVVTSSGASQHRIHTHRLDLSDPSAAASKQDGEREYDVAIVCASEIEATNTLVALKHLRQMMRPGAFLVLLHTSRQPLKKRMRRFGGSSGSRSREEEPPTPPDWPDMLDTCGFAPVGGPREQQQQCSGSAFSLIVRQTECQAKLALTKPLEAAGVVADSMLVVGGESTRVSGLREGVCSLLERHLGSMTRWARKIGHVSREMLDGNPVILMLADLDAPLMTGMNADSLEVFKAIFRPSRVILWVTLDSWSQPDHAATLGFARSMLAEVPSLTLQVVSLDRLDGSANTVAESLLRLALRPMTEGQDDSFLWTSEREVFIQNGRRLIPRILSYSEGNDRVRAAREVVSHELHTLEKTVDLDLVNSGGREPPYLEAHVRDDTPLVPGMSRIAVEYSTSRPVFLHEHGPVYLCVGRDACSSRPEQRLVLTTTPVQSSFAAVPSARLHDLGEVHSNYTVFLPILLRTVLGVMFAENLDSREIVVLEPEKLFVRALKQALAGSGTHIREVYINDTAAAAATATTASPSGEKTVRRGTFLHPNSSCREVRRLFKTQEGGHILSFLDEGHKISRMMAKYAPPLWTYETVHGLFSYAIASNVRGGRGERCLSEVGWAKAINMATELCKMHPSSSSSSSSSSSFSFSSSLTTWQENYISVPDATKTDGPPGPLQIVDWHAARKVQCVTCPSPSFSFSFSFSFSSSVPRNHHGSPLLLLSAQKTYLLVGMTRDLGQSICQLLAAHGARHMVVASRNPDPKQAWMSELAETWPGARVVAERLDVTDLDSVRALKNKISSSSSSSSGAGEPGLAPVVGGVINGAMVLEDRVFTHMDVATWERVMRPKTVGSRNLDVVFDGPEVEFFIMTSSFAATGGHAGQSNYATANMVRNFLFFFLFFFFFFFFFFSFPFKIMGTARVED